MLSTICNAVREILRADPSLTSAERIRLSAILRNHGNPEKQLSAFAAQEPRLIHRAEVARRFGCSLRAVDNWARAGILCKIKLPGRVRAAGFRESDIVELIEGKGNVEKRIHKCGKPQKEVGKKQPNNFSV